MRLAKNFYRTCWHLSRKPKLRSEHLEYLSDVIKENEYKIRNIRAFVLTAAYNAPSGIDAHYSALVSYDMRGGY